MLHWVDDPVLDWYMWHLYGYLPLNIHVSNNNCCCIRVGDIGGEVSYPVSDWVVVFASLDSIDLRVDVVPWLMVGSRAWWVVG